MEYKIDDEAKTLRLIPENPEEGRMLTSMHLDLSKLYNSPIYNLNSIGGKLSEDGFLDFRVVPLRKRE